MDAFAFLEHRSFLGNPLTAWALAALLLVAITLGLLLIRFLLKTRIVKVAARTTTRLDDFVVGIAGQTKLLSMIAAGGLAALAVLRLPDRTETVVRAILLVIIFIQAGLWGSRALREVVKQRFEGFDPDGTPRSGGGLVAAVSLLILWSTLLILALDNFGVNVTALIAGLGVGGIAVALAAQNVLGDLFASVAILLDKPFVIGDFIITGDLMGTVERIGIKTTRLRALGGEELVFANSDLLQSRVRNFKRMYERRVLFSVGIVYQTEMSTVEKIPSILRTCVEENKDVRFDRAHFKSYGDFALIFEIVYFVQSPEYNRYMDIQQAINLAIGKRFADEKIEFAYPTQTLFVAKEGPSDNEINRRLSGGQ